MSAESVENPWAASIRALQTVLEGAATSLPADIRSFETLRKHVRRVLLAAHKADRIREAQDQIHYLLRPCKTPSVRLSKELHSGAKILLGGGSDDGERFHDDPGVIPSFTRLDGARFDFTITVREERKKLHLLGYIFRLRFPDQVSSPRFLRVDMNLPDHKNEHAGLRVHLHPGHNDIQVPLPHLNPIEALQLFLYGLDVPIRQRHDQA